MRFIYCSSATATMNAATDPTVRDAIVGPGDVGAQTRQVLENLQQLLKLEDASIIDSVRVRVFVKTPMTREVFRESTRSAASTSSASPFPRAR